VTDYEEQIETWRAARHRRVSAPDGWLSLVGKHALRIGESSVGADPECDVPLPARAGVPARVGTFTSDGARVHFRAEAGAIVTCAGERVTARDIAMSDVLRVGKLSLEPLFRGATVYARVRDEDAPARLAFKGIPHFPVDPRWRIEATIDPFDPERDVELGYEEEQATTHYRSPGHAVFSHEGREQRVLVLYESPTPRTFLLFRDATSKDTTYGAGRFLYAPLPEGRRVVLDFNTAFNPPCALTDWASCPIVPPENILPFRIEAGEKRFHAAQSAMGDNHA
jgi:uncharacterized protein (DUF1684 family)